MSMITQCPSCGTAFRVTPQQLQAQHGMVRCGRCATVFDGFKSLATQREESRRETTSLAASTPRESGAVESPPPLPNVETTTTPVATNERPPASAALPTTQDVGAEIAIHVPPPADVVRPAIPEVQAGSPAHADLLPATSEVTADAASESPLPDVALPPIAYPIDEVVLPAEPEVPPPEIVPAAATPAPLSSDVVPPIDPGSMETVSTPATTSAEPQVVRESALPEHDRPVAALDARLAPAAVRFEAVPVPRRRSGALAFGSVILLLGLAAQGAYYFRGEIAAYVPEARPYLNRICEQLRCTIALPQQPRSVSIEASDLQAVDPANPGLIVLTATLRTQAPIALGYPALDVVLTNAKEHTVARRIFLPAEYMVAGKDVRAGFAPNAEMTIRLNIDSGDLGAAGFRLDLLAAPAQ